MIPPIAGSETMYTLPGLEEGTGYSITITATLTGGGNQEDVALGTTMAAGECISMQSNLLLLSLSLSFSHTQLHLPLPLLWES